MYHAFLSYSHRADARLAPVLQRALERLGTAWWRRSAVRVFRDDSSLPASPALWSGIEAALDTSEYLVLLASPAAAASPWVDQEVRWWLAHRSRARLLIVVTAGQITYDAGDHDFDWQRTDCLPPGLRGAFDAEPHWADLRFATGPEHLTLRHSKFRSAALSIAAALRGLAVDDLESADLLQHRRSVMILVGGLGVIGVLTLVTLGAVWIARSESVTARSNRLEADSRRLAAEALTQLDGGPGIEAATLKAAIAWRLSHTDEARRALQQIDKTTPDVARVLAQHTGTVRHLAFSRDNQRLVTAGDEGVVLQWSLADGRLLGSPLATEHQDVDDVRFSRDGSHLLVQGRRRSAGRDTPVVTVLRLADGTRLPLDAAWVDALPDARTSASDMCAAISPSGARVAMAIGDAVVSVGVPDGTPVVHRLTGKLRVTALGFSDENRLVLIADEYYGSGARAARIDLPSGGVTYGAQVHERGGQCRFTGVSDDAMRVAVWEGSVSYLLLWQIDERLALHPLPLPEPRPRLDELTGHYAPEFDAAGRRVAYGIAGTGYVWEPDTRRMVKTTYGSTSGHGPPLALSADGRSLASLDRNTPIVWRLDTSEGPVSIKGSPCGSGGLEDACIERLCERITGHVDEKRWRSLLGDEHATIMAALKGTACSSQGGRTANVAP